MYFVAFILFYVSIFGRATYNHLQHLVKVLASISVAGINSTDCLIWLLILVHVQFLTEAA